MLVIEDLQWADRSTRYVFAFLLRNARSGVMVVLTYRSDDLGRGHPLRVFLTELDRLLRPVTCPIQTHVPVSGASM